MSRLLYSATMSLDGFIAGPDGDMSWLTDLLPGEDAQVPELLAEIGSLLIGRRTWEGDDPNVGTDAEGAFGGQWDGPSVVLTHHAPDPAPPGVTFSSDLHEAVLLAKEAAGERYVNILGADVARQCLEAGVLDEILVYVAPVLLGEGTRLHEHPGGAHVLLEPIRPDRAGLRFRVVSR